MTFQEFQIASVRTCASLGSEQMDVIHCVLGLTSEIEELLESKDDVNFAEEIGDYCFYLANYCTFRGIVLKEDIEEQLSSVFSEHTDRPDLPILLLISSTAGLADLLKKKVAYGKEINEGAELDYLYFVFISCIKLLESKGYLLKDVLQTNVNKLLHRYPIETGFTTEKALNRDLTGERAILEQ